MNFRQRLLRFLIGIGIGLVMVNFFFGERGCMSWLPGSQVKKQIREEVNTKGMDVYADVKCAMDCQGLTEEDIKLVLGPEGDVEFKESQKDTIPKEYVISGRRDGMEFKFGFLLRPDTSNVVTFAKRMDENIPCQCE